MPRSSRPVARHRGGRDVNDPLSATPWPTAPRRVRPAGHLGAHGRGPLVAVRRHHSGGVRRGAAGRAARPGAGATAALADLRRGGGAFISMSSMGSSGASPCRPPTARPHGIDGFLETLRVELQRDGVRSASPDHAGHDQHPLFQRRDEMGSSRRPAARLPGAVVADAIVHAAEHLVRDLVARSGQDPDHVEKFARGSSTPCCAGSATTSTTPASPSPRTHQQPRRAAHRQRHRRRHRRRGHPAAQRLHLAGHPQTRPHHGPHARRPAGPAARPASPRVARRRGRDRRRAPRLPPHGRRALHLTFRRGLAPADRGTFDARPGASAVYDPRRQREDA